jgi:hypothetical protein
MVEDKGGGIIKKASNLEAFLINTICLFTYPLEWNSLIVLWVFALESLYASHLSDDLHAEINTMIPKINKANRFFFISR